MPPGPLDSVLFNRQTYINCFAICMLSWNSRSNKSLKMPSDSISEGLNFLGGSDPPRFCMPDCVLLTQLSCLLQCIFAPPFCESWICPWTSNYALQSTHNKFCNIFIYTHINFFMTDTTYKE